jgi:hypothetical protein
VTQPKFYRRAYLREVTKLQRQANALQPAAEALGLSGLGKVLAAIEDHRIDCLAAQP